MIHVVLVYLTLDSYQHIYRIRRSPWLLDDHLSTDLVQCERLPDSTIYSTRTHSLTHYTYLGWVLIDALCRS